MKATCKSCNAVIETEPDSVMDEGHERRELTAFWNRLAFHVDPRNRQCANDSKLVQSAFAAQQRDNGWFQRWRLLARCKDLDAFLLGKQEEWREYFHTITTAPADVPQAPEPDESKAVH
jgi:hypothetical protein